MNAQVGGNGALFPEMRSAATVVGHERSGTHFRVNRPSAVG
jgi:hypothetical protein